MNAADDFPCFGAVVQKLRPSRTPLPSGISLNAPANQVSANNHIFPGFFAGLIGNRYDPLFIDTVARRVAAPLAARGIETGIHYPLPIHLQQAYANLGYAAGSFPCSERVAAEDRIPFVTVAELRTLLDRRDEDNVYVFDGEEQYLYEPSPTVAPSRPAPPGGWKPSGSSMPSVSGGINCRLLRFRRTTDASASG